MLVLAEASMNTKNILDQVNEFVVQMVKPPVVSGMKFTWTGFKAWPNNALLIGQWITTPVGEECKERFKLLPSPVWEGTGNWHGVYSSTPGVVSAYNSGDTFDISIREDQVYLQVDDFDVDLKGGYETALKACEQARDKLIDYLVEHAGIERAEPC